MTEAFGKLLSWIPIGSAQTSPVDNRVRTRVIVDSWYVVVGFEVNNPKAFVNDVHDLSIDYGHAFIYLVRNRIIEASLSFGPDDAPPRAKKITTLLPNGLVRARAQPATADYPIGEDVRAFKLPVTHVHAMQLKNEIRLLRFRISEKKVEYAVLVNDTCAETAQETLSNAGIETPSSAGWIIKSGTVDQKLFYAATPYKWHKNFKKKYSEVIKLAEPGIDLGIRKGMTDPIFGVSS